MQGRRWNHLQGLVFGYPLPDWGSACLLKRHWASKGASLSLSWAAMATGSSLTSKDGGNAPSCCGFLLAALQFTGMMMMKPVLVLSAALVGLATAGEFIFDASRCNTVSRPRSCLLHEFAEPERLASRHQESLPWPSRSEGFQSYLPRRALYGLVHALDVVSGCQSERTTSAVLTYPCRHPPFGQNWNTASNWDGGEDPWSGAAVPSSVTFGLASSRTSVRQPFNPINVRLPQGNFAMGSLLLKRNMAISLPRDGAALVFPQSGATGQPARFTAGQDDLETACDAGKYHGSARAQTVATVNRMLPPPPGPPLR